MRIESDNISEYYNSHFKGETNRRDNSSKKINKVELSQMDNNISNNNQLKLQEHDVIQAIEKANKKIKSYDRRLEFSIHEKTKQIMVKVIDTEDDSIIREIPSEKILDMVAKLWELAGLFVDEKR